MDVFDSAARQYKSNFLQYSLTDDPKYKVAYEAAQKTLDSLTSQIPEEEHPKAEHDSARSILGITIATPSLGQSQTWKYWVIGGLVLASALSML